MRTRSFANLLRKTWRMGPLYPTQLLLSRLLPSTIVSINAVLIAEYRTAEAKPPSGHLVNIRWAQECDAKLFSETPYTAQQFRERISRGDSCVILQESDIVAAYSWYVAGSYEQYDWLRFALPQTAVWGSDMWVSPKFRGHGFHALLSQFTHAAFRAQSIAGIVVMVDVLNKSARKAVIKSGGQIHQRIFFARLLGLTFVQVAGAPKFGIWHRRRRFEVKLERFLKH